MTKEELTHKVYFATFDEPKYVMEIGNIIYGVEKQTYPKLMGENSAIDKCLKRGWIEDVTKSIEIPDPKPLGFEKRRYYKAKLDPLIDQIKGISSLDSFDEYILRDKFNSRFVRYLIQEEISKSLKNTSFYSIENVLLLFEFIVIIFEDEGAFERHSQGIETIDQYEKKKDEISQKIKSIIENRPDLKELFDQEKISLEVFIDMFVFFIFPKKVLDKSKTIGIIRILFHTMTSFSNTISQFPDLNIELLD